MMKSKAVQLPDVLLMMLLVAILTFGATYWVMTPGAGLDWSRAKDAMRMLADPYVVEFPHDEPWRSASLRVVGNDISTMKRPDWRDPGAWKAKHRTGMSGVAKIGDNSFGFTVLILRDNALAKIDDSFMTHDSELREHLTRNDKK